MTSVEEEFRELGVLRGNLLMLRPADAIVFIRRCRERGVKVLGVDGFHLTDETTQPDRGESIDLSGCSRRGGDSWNQAEGFLNERIERDLFFEVVTDE